MSDQTPPQEKQTMFYDLTLTTLAVAAMLSIHVSEMLAQGSTATLTGTVIDSATGLPIVDVAVYVDGKNLADSTDDAGKYLVSGLSTGEHIAYLMKAGYVPATLQFTFPDESVGQIDVGVTVLSRGPAPLATLAGTVVDAQTEQPVMGASVALNGQTRILTDALGTFRIPTVQAKWGVNALEIRRIGYALLTAELWVAEQETDLDLDIALVPSAVRMTEVVIEGERVSVPARLAGFYQRREVGIGKFLTVEDWERRPDSNAGQVLHRIPSIRVAGWRVLIATAPFTCRRQGTSARIWVDNVSVHPAFIQDINIDNVVAIEVYDRLADTPAQYNSSADQVFSSRISASSAACGVVVIWTR